MLDSMFKGLNLCAPATLASAGIAATNSPCGGLATTYGAIGTTVAGVPQTSAQQLRLLPTLVAGTAFNSLLANGNYAPLAGFINTLNYVKTAGCSVALGDAGNCNVPDLPATAGQLVNGAAMRFNGLFPENFIVNNPQYSAVNYFTNLGHSNYHSMQVEGTYRPTQGVSLQGTYTFSKNLGLPGTFTNPVDRHKDYTIVNSNRPQQLRTNAVFELPMGPNKVIAGNSTGAVARAIEHWQLGMIYNYNTGTYSNIGVQSMLYANATPDVVPSAFTAAAMKALSDGKVTWDTRNTSGTGIEGRYFGDLFGTVPDPQCATVTSVNGLNANNKCSLRALAYIVPAGTPGSVTVTDTVAVQNPLYPDQPSNTINVTRTRSGIIVLQHPQPGTRGTLGQNTIKNVGNYSLDANISKQFRITESKAVLIRIDTTNVLNHPTPNGPNLTLNPVGFPATVLPFGQITAKTGGRAFQGQVRFNF
jgi:hypothetical protein